MKVTFRMIDRQLRLIGVLLRLVFSKRSEKDLRKKNPLMQFLKGRKPKDLFYQQEWIARPDGSRLRIVIYKPLKGIAAGSEVPGVLWLHGGGYAIGVPEQEISYVRKMIAASNCVVVVPDYRLSPEAPYPAALDDCYTALRWMQAHAAELGYRPNQLAVGGESAGGGLTAALTLYARDQGEVNIAFQLPFYPMLDDRMTSESARDNNAPAWDSVSNASAWKLYLGPLLGQQVPPYAAPARATEYRGLPPTITFVGELEPFRDETLAYVDHLREAGVPVDFELYPGCYHAFDSLAPWASVSKKATAFWLSRFRYAVQHHFAEQPA